MTTDAGSIETMLTAPIGVGTTSPRGSAISVLATPGTRPREGVHGVGVRRAGAIANPLAVSPMVELTFQVAAIRVGEQVQPDEGAGGQSAHEPLAFRPRRRAALLVCSPQDLPAFPPHGHRS